MSTKNVVKQFTGRQFRPDFQIPTRENSLTGYLGDERVTLFAITRRVSGDTEFNERREVCGITIHHARDHRGVFNVENITDKKLANKIFDLYFDGYPQVEEFRVNEAVKP